MIFGKTKLELKVGVFVFTGLMIFTIFIFSIGGIKTWAGGYDVSFVFHFVNGVKIGAPVRFAGVDVGQVKKITFLPPGKDGKITVKIAARIRNGTKVPVDSNVWVNTLGFLGEKYIEIMPGIDFNNCLAKNQVLTGQDPMAMQEVGEMAKKIVTDIDNTILKINSGEGTVGKLLSNDSLYNNLDAFVADIKKNPWKLLFKGKEKHED